MDWSEGRTPRPLRTAEDAVGLEQTENDHSRPTRGIEAKAERHATTESLVSWDKNKLP